MCTKLSWHPYKKLRVSSVLLSWIAPDMSRSHLITIANGIVAISQAQVGLVFLRGITQLCNIQLQSAPSLLSSHRQGIWIQWLQGQRLNPVDHWRFTGRNPSKSRKATELSTRINSLADSCAPFCREFHPGSPGGIIR